MSQKVLITIHENGPIQVKNATSLRFAGEPVGVEGDLYLCRCGQSKNAPFCDGTHKKVGFQGGAEVEGNKDLVVWEGSALKTHFNPNVCMHAAYCKPLNGLRALERSGDESAAERIMEVVQSCPSGALTYERKGGLQGVEAAEAGAQIEVMEGGEVRVQAEFEINAPLRERQPTDRATLCRCGLSKSKPWCDGRHKKREDFR